MPVKLCGIVRGDVDGSIRGNVLAPVEVLHGSIALAPSVVLCGGVLGEVHGIIRGDEVAPVEVLHGSIVHGHLLVPVVLF